MPTIDVLLADAQYLVREGLKAILGSETDVRIVGEVERAEQLLPAIERWQPDLVILDHDTPEFFAEGDLTVFRELQRRTNVLVISQEHDQVRIKRVLEQGVNAFLTKYCDRGEIVSAVRAAVRSEKYFCSKVLDILIDNVREDSAEACVPSTLTAREVEIVRLVAQGARTREVAEQLHLSPHTVNTHRKNIFKKLGIRSGSELVLYAVNTGIIQPAVSGRPAER
jgi:DNA-binding NarL/FixJ family response regulator